MTEPQPAPTLTARYVVDREILIAAYSAQAWSSPDQMADMLLEGLAALEPQPVPSGLDVDLSKRAIGTLAHGRCCWDADLDASDLAAEYARLAHSKDEPHA